MQLGYENPHGEGLVEIHMAYITPTGCWVGETDLSVQVGTVQVHLATILMDDATSL